MFLTALEGAAQAQIQDGEVSIDITNEGTVDYSVQFVQPNVPVKKGAEYIVRFDAYADENRTMKSVSQHQIENISVILRTQLYL